MKLKSHPVDCPCASGLSYARCCAPLHNNVMAAADALALMRSRYSAYALELEAYLLQTWYVDTRPSTLDLHAEKTKWIGLEIRSHVQTGSDSATVEFVARYRVAGRAHRLHEISRFRREEGLWYYIDGQFPV